MNWTFYVLNRCPTFAVKDITPQEAWSGIKPSVNHFRVFGCLAHVHIPDVRRGKLDNKSFPCVLLGVSEESKGYRLFDLIAKKIIVSRDVVFEEEKQWDWDVSYEKQILLDLEWGENEENSERDRENDGGAVNDGEGSNSGVEFGEENRVEVSENEEGKRGPDEVGEDEGREKGPPVWMQDYVTREGLSEYEANMALIMSADPVFFEEVVKNENWRLAMDCEINSIEKNKTWTLNELPVGAK